MRFTVNEILRGNLQKLAKQFNSACVQVSNLHLTRVGGMPKPSNSERRPISSGRMYKGWHDDDDSNDFKLDHYSFSKICYFNQIKQF